MGYKNKNKQRAYQRRWLKDRKRKYFADHGPCRGCGSPRDLEIHHEDPSQKVTHRVWSWSEERRNAELAKCAILCYDCHIKITAIYNSTPVIHGTKSAYSRGCRCRSCREAQRVYCADWRKRKMYS